MGQEERERLRDIRNIGIAPSRDHAVVLTHRVEINGADASVGIGRPVHRHVNHLGQFDVIDKTPAAGEKSSVFTATNAGANVSVTHTSSPRSSAAAMRPASTMV